MPAETTKEFNIFLFETVDLVMNHFIKDGVRPPTLFTDDKKTHRMVTNDAQKAIDEARSMIPKLGEEVKMYCIVYEGYVTIEEKKYDVVYFEAAERGKGEGMVLGQRFKPKKFLSKFELIGNPGLVGPSKNLFAE